VVDVSLASFDFHVSLSSIQVESREVGHRTKKKERGIHLIKD